MGLGATMRRTITITLEGKRSDVMYAVERLDQEVQSMCELMGGFTVGMKVPLDVGSEARRKTVLQYPGDPDLELTDG